MVFKIKNIICSISFLLIALSSLSQIGIEQMINVKLGETFNESKNKIKAMFSQKAKVMKADFLGAYRINYENIPFNYYGDADYTFQYVKDTLVSVKIEFTFIVPDTIKFKRLYNTLINDLNSDKSKKLVKEYSNLNPKNIFQYIKSECRTTTEETNKDYKPIKKKYFGQNFWAIYNNSIISNKFLRLNVQMEELHNYNNDYGNVTRYDGCGIGVTLELTSENFQDLKYQEETLEISNYHSLNDDEAQIKLKFQDGVYLVPVKLNNMLSMDFVLDLGASDVSISPDVFLVLYKAGTIKDEDFIGSQTYQFADGTTAKSNVLNLKSIQIGDKEIYDVRVSISNSISSPLLLGQSALRKLGNYKIDNFKNLLIVE